MSETSTRQAAEAAAPLQDFSRCHVGFVTLLETSLGLPEMVAPPHGRAGALQTC
jgi:hypothetical protein